MDEFLSSLLAEHEANAERTALLINGPISELAKKSSRIDEAAPFSEDFKELSKKEHLADFLHDCFLQKQDDFHGCAPEVFCQRFELK